MNSAVDSTKCTYQTEKGQKQDPHIHQIFTPERPRIYQNVLDAIGNTPMIKINRIFKEKNMQCQFFAKCEFMNMGGSVKDRIGRRMIIDAEKTGQLKPGDKVIEATSGNTGIGLSLAAAVKGYEMIICMPEKMSAEKANVLKGLGAKIIRTPTQCAFDHPDSHLSIAQRYHDEGKAVMLNQYNHPSNPLAHYDSLAEEIIYQTQGKVDAIIIGVGTGGTICGVGRKFKEKHPQTIIVGADPLGSILALPQSLNIEAPPNKVEGIGYDFIPRVLDRKVIDHWVKTDDLPSFVNARDLIRKEGLLVGGSSGSVVQAAEQFIKAKGWENDPSKRIVCVFSDSVRNYITKFLSKQWCIEGQFLPYDELKEENHPWNGVKISELNLPTSKAYTELTVGQAKQIFSKGARAIPVKIGKHVQAAIFPKKFLQLVILKNLKSEDSAIKAKTKDFAIVPDSLDVAQLSKILERHDAVFIHKSGEEETNEVWVGTAEDTFKLMK